MNSVSLNDIPYEVLYNIYSKVCQCNSPLLNYRIQLNLFFYFFLS